MKLDEHIYIGFYTATILEWKELLKPDKYKEIIINSLKFLCEEKRTEVYRERAKELYEIYFSND